VELVYVCFRRWAEQGVWNAMLTILVDLGLTDDWRYMIDSAIVRGHSHAAGAKGDLQKGRWSKPRRLYKQNARPL
jgi:transposase